MKLSLVVLVLLLAASAGLAEPALHRSEDGSLEVVRLPALLDDKEVRPHLESGLTTTLELRLSASSWRSADPLGGAKIEIRYELWDEVFLVSVYEIGRPVRRHSLASMDALEEWWSGLRLHLTEADSADSGLEVLRLRLRLLPFSQPEQVDAQRWFAESIQRNSRRAGDERRAGAQDSAALERVFSVLVATSIQRRAVIEREWRLSRPVDEVPP